MPSIMKGDVLVHMTDNERRAHDLAIATLPFLRDNHYAMIENGDIPEGTAFDVFEQYMACYETSLESFNHEFPDGK